MSKKPGWQTVQFGEVVKLNKERVADPATEGIERYVGIEHIEPEDLRIRSWGLVAEGTTFTNYFRPGQVLFVKRRAYQRKVALADISGVCSGDIYVLEPRDSRVLLPELLPFICQTDGFFNHAVGTSAGSLSPRTNWKQLANYEFALPPLEEQLHISKLLWSLERLARELHESLTDNVKLVQSVFSHLFQEDQELKSSRVADVSTLVTNGFVGTAAKYYVTNGVPYLRSKNIRRNRIDTRDLVQVSENFHLKNKKSILRQGDLLTVQSGHVGETAVVPEECSGWNCHALIITRLKKGVMLPEYVSMYLNSVQGQKNLAKYIVGSTVVHVNTSDLAKMKIPSPSLARQNSVVLAGRQLLSSAEPIQKRIDDTNAIKTFLLSRVFEGKDHPGKQNV